MTWTELEKCFNRAFYLSFSRKRLILTFPPLLLCGVLVVFCRALSHDATPWLKLCLGFLPIFLSSGVLLGLGVVLARIYSAKPEHSALSLRRLMSSSIDLMIGISYIAVPSLLIYLVFWIFLGVFFLLKEIPGIGEFFSVVFSFGPFILIFGSLILCLINLGLLFFVAPAATLLSMRRGSLAKRVFDSLKKRVFSAIVLLIIGMIPLLFVSWLLYFSALLTNTSFFLSEDSLSVAMEWFFVMIPFAALMTPSVVFFFNFSTESYALLQTAKE